MPRFTMDGVGTLHVAKRKRGGWKVLCEGDAVAASEHETKEAAIASAKALAEQRPGSLVKVHREDNTVEAVIPFSEAVEIPS